MKTFMTTAAAIALLSLPDATLAATDGTLGATSTGSFTANVAILPNTTNDVQIRGLQDVDLGTFILGGIYGVPQSSLGVCFTKNTTGNVRLEVTSQGSVPGYEFRLYDSSGTEVSIQSGVFVFPASPVSCVAGNLASGGYLIRNFHRPGSATVAGTFTQQVTLVLSPL